MATLSLKKPKRIDSPLHQFNGQFVVMRHSRNSHSFRFAFAHQTQDQATKEAKRLAAELKTERFLVLQIVDSVEGNNDAT
jgi:hypothetical protein